MVWLSHSIRRASRLSQASIFGIGPAIATASALIIGLSVSGGQSASIKVDMASSSGRNLEVFLNDLSLPPLRQALVPGVRRIYTFEGISDDISMFRLDPTDIGDAGVELYAVEVVGADGVLARFESGAMAAWAKSGLDVTSVDATALRLKSTTNDPILATNVSVDVSPPAAEWLVEVTQPQFEVTLVVACLVGLVSIGVLDRARRFHIVVVAVALAVAIIMVPWIAGLTLGTETPAIAVSRATFFGLSTQANQVASVMPVLISALVAVVIGWLSRGWATHGPGGDDGEQPRVANVIESPFGRRWLGRLGLIAIALLTVPDLPSTVQNAALRQFAPHWDSENLLYWEYLVQSGYLPFRDFWYPYGGTYLFDFPLPYGLIFRWLYGLLLFGTFMYSCWTLTRRASVALLLTGLFLAADRLAVLPAMSRYLLAVNVVLTYVSTDRRIRSGPALFWMSCCAALLVEPSQLLYAAPAVLVLLVLDLCRKSNDARSRTAGMAARLLADFAVPLTFAVAYAAWLAAHRQLTGFVEFYANLGDTVAYSAWPTDLRNVWNEPLSLRAVAVVAPAVLVSLGVYEYVRNRFESRYGQVLIGIGLLSVLVLQKDIVRPINEQILLFPVVGTVMYVAGWPFRRTRVELVWLGVLTGVVLGRFAMLPGAGSQLDQMLGGPQHFAQGIELLALQLHKVDRANSQAFASERFSLFPGERQVIDHLTKRSSSGKLAVFGISDNPVLYALTGQAPVWLPNTYNASPIYEQQRMVRWLEDSRPEFVILDAGRLDFDGFQKVVRVPLIFTEVIENYVPDGEIGDFDILRRRDMREPIPLAFWRAKLGDVIDLGHLPGVSTFEPGRQCAEVQCREVLQVTLADGEPTPRRERIGFESGGLEFRVIFDVPTGGRPYYIALDRLWFWQVARRHGVDRRILENDVSRLQLRVLSGPSDSALY